MTAPMRWYIGRSRARSWGAASLALLTLYAALVAAEARRSGLAFDAVDPWPLGGPHPNPALGLASLALGLGLGWAVPGLCLALLGEREVHGSRLLARGFGLGVGYLFVAGLAVALVTGGAPTRTGLLVLLSLPALTALLRSATPHESLADGTLLAAALSMIFVTAWLWPKLSDEGLSGDGSEAYELAQSLGESRLPRWDLERPDGPGRYGHPAVNPFLTNSFLVHAQMSVVGRGELAARLPFPAALVTAALLAAALAGRLGASAWVYAGALAAVSLLWNAYYVGYEPAFADLAEPAATDLLMTALWLCGAVEIAGGSVALGVAFLFLASGVLYSAPLLASVALGALASSGEPRGRRALGLWLGGLTLAGLAALSVGIVTGSWPDWIRQVRSEYWQDVLDTTRTVPTLPLLGRLVLMTGALPLIAAARFRRITPVPHALLVAAGVYVALVAGGHSKNLHYLAPLPFLLMPGALEASEPRLRLAASVLLAAVFALSWPSPRDIHRENVALGERSCLDGLDLETAALGGDVLYQAFAGPGASERFAVGKHTFVRYAAERGGRDCAFRLSNTEREGWVTIAGSTLTFSVRDVEEYVRWRFARPSLPSSPLFRRTPAPPLPLDPAGWLGRHVLAERTGQALLLDGFARLESNDPGNPRVYAGVRSQRPRLLVPRLPESAARIRTWSPEGGLELTLRVNGRPDGRLNVPPGWSEVRLPMPSDRWRTGWNVVELAGDAQSLPHLALDWLDLRRASQ